MFNLVFSKITVETLQNAACAEHRTSEDALAQVSAVAEACADITAAFHGDLAEAAKTAYINQGLCLSCLAGWAFRLGVLCANEQIQQDRLKAALEITDSEGGGRSGEQTLSAISNRPRNVSSDAPQMADVRLGIARTATRRASRSGGVKMSDIRTPAEVSASIVACLDRLETRDALRAELHDWLRELLFEEREIEALRLDTLRQLKRFKALFEDIEKDLETA